jgi:hypothetical protein
MKKFLKIRLLHPNNVEGDTIRYIAIDEIVAIQAATEMDRKHRSEMQALVETKTGGYATSMKPQEILEALDELTIS